MEFSLALKGLSMTIKIYCQNCFTEINDLIGQENSKPYLETNCVVPCFPLSEKSILIFSNYLASIFYLVFINSFNQLVQVLANSTSAGPDKTTFGKHLELQTLNVKTH